MLNFVLGAVAGALMATVATIAAVRNPDVQVRMGLVRPQLPAVALRRPEPVCPPPAAPPSLAGVAPVGQPDMLFARRRFWSVAPP
ncbi:conserved hypothetical protein [Methylobacterium sp. 4-46]|uniref:hypothetical protein n=1 Tax=unclassified Methylobacterium TaxID=2615210 RepID=UPI000165C9F2|nr:MULTISPECIES: hypothetical protein [Methylobacterium]ACA15445.1 conserved hypothetical protein [Methylobacterium sp. 4-46]WFT81164.1 hypothetical protein QA634_04470 [Methylobacterium nodulans]